jgi:hypothetical protein
MPSQTDLDQGGTFRQWWQLNLGPSMGRQMVPLRNRLSVTTAAAASALLLESGSFLLLEDGTSHLLLEH